MFCCCCIQNVKDGIQIQVYNTNNESVNHVSQFISVKVKKNFRKSQAQVQEKLRKLRLRHGFLIKKTCMAPALSKSGYPWYREKAIGGSVTPDTEQKLPCEMD